MTTITVLPEETKYRALAGEKQSTGRTVGEAIDNLAAQLSDDENGTLLIVQRQRAGKFFGAREQQRLAELMTKKSDAVLSPQEKSELEALIEAELHGARARAEELLGGIKS